MSEMSEATSTVTLRVHRFTPRPEREQRARGGSPFARKASPFGADASARRRPRGKQWVQDYVVPAHPEDTVLDCLLTIKRTIDPSLAFRYSCGHGICGSDAASVNGTPTLLCKARVRDWAQADAQAVQTAAADNDGFRKTGAQSEDNNPSPAEPDSNNSGNIPASLGIIELASLPGFPPVRDLVADIDPMLDQIRKLTPYLRAEGTLAETKDGKLDVFEYLQHPEQLARFETLSNCIACGVCEGSCPVFAGGDPFIGPAALVWASRFINDSRDTATDERMDAIDTADGVAACQSVRACSRQCPQGIDVGEEMWQIIAKVRER